MCVPEMPEVSTSNVKIRCSIVVLPFYFSHTIFKSPNTECSETCFTLYNTNLRSFLSAILSHHKPQKNQSYEGCTLKKDRMRMGNRRKYHPKQSCNTGRNSPSFLLPYLKHCLWTAPICVALLPTRYMITSSCVNQSNQPYFSNAFSKNPIWYSNNKYLYWIDL